MCSLGVFLNFYLQSDFQAHTYMIFTVHTYTSKAGASIAMIPELVDFVTYFGYAFNYCNKH